MPKKKKKSKSKGKRRGVGAANGGGNDFMRLAGALTGAVVTKIGTKKIIEKKPDWNKTVVKAVPAGVGALIVLNPFKKIRVVNSVLKHPFVNGMGYGMGVMGGVEVLQEMDMIGEIDVPINQYRRRVAGPGQVPTVGQLSNAYPYNRVPTVGEGNTAVVPTVGQSSRRKMAAM